MDVFDRFKKIIDCYPALIGVVHTTPMHNDQHFIIRIFKRVFVLIGILLPGCLLYTILWFDGELALKVFSVLGTSLKVCLNENSLP